MLLLKIRLTMSLCINCIGNSSTSCNWKDDKRPYYVLCCNFGDILLCCSFWVLGIWKQVQLQHFEEFDARWWTFFGSNFGPWTRYRLCSSSTLRNRSGKLTNTNIRDWIGLNFKLWSRLQTCNYTVIKILRTTADKCNYRCGCYKL